MATESKLLQPILKVTPKEPVIPDLAVLVSRDIKCSPKMLNEIMKIAQDLTESLHNATTDEIKVFGQLTVYVVSSSFVRREKIVKIPPIKTTGVKFKKIKRKVGDYEVTLTLEDEGIFSVEIPKLPGCITFGNTIAEALKNAREAIDCHLGAIRKHQK